MPKVESFEKHVDIYEEWFVRNRFEYESELQAICALLPEDGKGIAINSVITKMSIIFFNFITSRYIIII